LGPILDYVIVPDGRGLKGGLVEKWEMAPDGLSWIYHVRKGIKFQDGSDMTAKDVKFSLDGYISNDAFVRLLPPLVDHIDLVDDYTVRVYSQGTQPDLPWFTSCSSVSSGPGEVIPKAYIDQHGWTYFENHPMGSGPWKFVSQVYGDMIEYEAKDKHWQQAPEFKKFTLILMPEETTRVASLKTGEVDAIDVGLDSAYELEKAGYSTGEFIGYSSMVMLHGAYQTGAGPIADVRVRHALSMAINRDEINKTFFYGKSSPPGPPWESEDSGDYDLSYWMDYAAKAWRYDPAAATQLLKDAGYPNGFKIQLWTYPMEGAPYLPNLAQIVQGYWLKIGVNAQIVPTDDGYFRPLRNTLKAPNMIGAASTYRNSCGPNSPRNIASGYSSVQQSICLVGKAMPDLDNLITLAGQEMDPTKKADLISKAIQISFDTWTTLMIGRVPNMVAMGPRVNITFPKPSDSLPMCANLFKHKK
jgi:peptide/nickel transport system substrate-binding protein